MSYKSLTDSKREQIIWSKVTERVKDTVGAALNNVNFQPDSCLKFLRPHRKHIERPRD